MNRKMKLILAQSAALVLVTNGAYAADFGPTAPSWTGFYLGVGGGGAYNLSELNASAGGLASAQNVSSNYSTPYSFDDNLVDALTNTQFGSGDFTLDNAASAYAGVATYAQVGKGSGNLANLLTSGSSFETPVQNIINSILNSDDSDSGVANAYGLAKIGYDYQIGNLIVVGVAADYRFGSANIKDSSSSVWAYQVSDEQQGGGEDDYNESAGLLNVSLKAEDSWSVGGRIGLIATDSTLLYASGGYTRTKAKLRTSFNSADVWFEEEGVSGNAASEGSIEFDMTDSRTQWLDGYYLGGGVEMMLMDNFMLGFEYRFADLGGIESAVSYSDATSNAQFLGGLAGDASLATHSVNATLSYKFNM